MSDLITEDQKALLLKKLGMNPWDAQVVIDGDQVHIVPTPTEPTSIMGSIGKGLLSKVPRQWAATAGGLAGAGIAQPIIEPAAAVIAGASGPAGVLTGPATSVIGSALAYGVGSELGEGAYNKLAGRAIDDSIYGSPANQMRDKADHPWIDSATDKAAMLASFQFSNPIKIAKALGQATRLGLLRTGETALTAEGKEVLKNAARNVLGNTAGTAMGELQHDGKLDPKALATTAVEGLFLGAPRGPLKHIQPGTEALTKAIMNRGRAPAKPAELAPIPQGPGDQMATTADFVPDLMRPNGIDIMGGDPRPKYNPDIMNPQPDLMAPQGPWARSSTPADHPPFNPEDTIGLNVARARGVLADEMANARQGRFGRSTAETMGPEVPPGYVGTADPMEVPFGPQVPQAHGPELPPGYAGPSTGEAANLPKDQRQLLYFLRNLDPSKMVMRQGSGTPSTADPGRPEWLAPGRTEAEILQDRLEGNKSRYQPVSKKDEGSALDPEREALKRRGFGFEETQDPIVMPNGGLASGATDARTGEIKISMPHVQPDTHVHEGMHAELVDMANSPNPHVNKAATEILEAAHEAKDPEEFLVNLATAHSRGSRERNPLMRYLADNWNALNIIAGRQSPKRMAQSLAERFDYKPAAPVNQPEQIKSSIGNSGEFSKSNGDIRYQALTDKDILVPSSVLGKAADEDPQIGRAAAKAFNEIDINIGHINKAVEALGKFDPQVVQSALWKRSRAGQFRTQPQFTPEEMAVNAEYQKVMDVTAALATKHGYPITQLANYVPEALNAQAARAYESKGEAYVQEMLPKFLDLNNKIFKGIDPKDAEEYFRHYLDGVAKAPNSLGSEFGALTKSKRQYHLPDEMREQDMIKNLQRYGNRWARGVAVKQHIRNDPYVAGRLGYNSDIVHPSGVEAPSARSPAMTNLRQALDDTLFNVGRGSTGTSQDVRDVVMAGQQVVNSAAMQTLTNVKNTISKVPMHLISAQHPEQAAALITGTMRTYNEYATQKQKAIEANVVRPHTDPAQNTDGLLLSKTAERLHKFGLGLRKWTASEFLETFNRVHDYTIGEDLAHVNIELAKKGEPSAKRFLEQFGYGADSTQPLAEQVQRIARNYAKGIQSTYTGEGLPAMMLRGGPVPMALRIQRFGVENFNRTRQMVIRPAMEGNYGPLVAYVLGAVATVPVIGLVTKLLTGRPSGLPTEKEMRAGKKNLLAQKTLNVMQMAQLTGAFGTAGNVAGTLAGNYRGGQQQLIGDPSISFASDLVMNLAAASEAISQDEPSIGVLQEVLKRTIIDNMQLARGLTTDQGEAQDTRNKRTFEYQTEQRQVPITDMAHATVLGTLFSDRTPQISPTKEAAKKGDRAAWAKTPVNERATIDNYRGGFESPEKEGAYQQYLLKTQGPMALEAYRARRLKAKMAAQPK